MLFSQSTNETKKKNKKNVQIVKQSKKRIKIKINMQMNKKKEEKNIVIFIFVQQHDQNFLRSYVRILPNGIHFKVHMMLDVYFEFLKQEVC